jgi:hypothetical protein
MPIVKKPDGWYWGSKGPFATKQKAADVGAAAHAHGYKEQQMNDTKTAEFIATLLHSATITHIMHFQVQGEGSNARHMTLGTYYDEIVELVDGLTESIQGLYDIVRDYPTSFGMKSGDPLEYMKSLQTYVVETRTQLPQDSEIQNEIDGIATLINTTLYKLRNLR